MREKEPLHKIVQAWATTLSLILIPLIIGYMANSYQAEMNQQKLNTEYIALAISILKEDPTPKNRELRLWSINIIDKYSEVKFNPKVKESLATEIKIATAKERVLQKAKDFLAIPYSFGSDTANIKQCNNEKILHKPITKEDFRIILYKQYGIDTEQK